MQVFEALFWAEKTKRLEFFLFIFREKIGCLQENA